MSLNSTDDLTAQDYESISFALKLLVLTPDYLNVILLSAGMYGMYHGVEIQHPLYLVLFLNLVASWVSSLMNIVGFPFLPSLAHVKLTNVGSTAILFFHCVCWLLTSVIRHLYIVNDAWLHSKVPSTKIQSYLAILSAVVLTAALASPCFAYLVFLGKCVKYRTVPLIVQSQYILADA